MPRPANRPCSAPRQLHPTAQIRQRRQRQHQWQQQHTRHKPQQRQHGQGPDLPAIPARQRSWWVDTGEVLWTPNMQNCLFLAQHRLHPSACLPRQCRRWRVRCHPRHSRRRPKDDATAPTPPQQRCPQRQRHHTRCPQRICCCPLQAAASQGGLTACLHAHQRTPLVTGVAQPPSGRDPDRGS
jgi:hypothetical protein